jgi:hypothetical protein
MKKYLRHIMNQRPEKVNLWTWNASAFTKLKLQTFGCEIQRKMIRLFGFEKGIKDLGYTTTKVV